MRLLWLLLACLLGVCAVAQPLPPPPPDPTQGAVHGMIICDDGLPFDGAGGVVRCATQSVDFTTDKDGFFTLNIKAGEAQVLCYGTTTKVTVVAGKMTNVQAQVKRPGLIVTISNADGTPCTAQVTGNVCGKTAVWHMVNVRALGEGRYWFVDAAPGITTLAVQVALPANGPGTTFGWTQTLAIPANPAPNTLTIKLPALQHLHVTVVDLKGQPLPNATVNGKVSYFQNTPWSYDPADRVSQLDRRLVDQVTDDKGELDLGEWPPMTFVLSLHNGGQFGASLRGELKADGTCTPARYPLGFTPRTVTQTVFSAAGKPVPNAVVGLSYAWSGRVCMLQRRTDAAGRVAWAALPPVRAVTWGAGAAPGVLPADATDVTAPLPRPVPGASVNLLVTQKSTLDAPADGVLGLQSMTLSNTCTVHLAAAQDPPTTAQADGALMLQVQKAPPSGTPFTLGTLFSSSPPKLTMLLGAYMPYVDDGLQTVDFPLSELPVVTQDGVDATIHLVGADGKPVPGISYLTVVPVAPQESWALFGNEIVRVSAADISQAGLAHVLLPAAGTYRVLVDLAFDTPLTDALTLKLAAGKEEATVTLPAPLFTVPADTEVCYLPRNAPTQRHTLNMPHAADARPVYGLPDALLAAWYYDGGKLQVLMPGATPAQRALTARKTQPVAKNADGATVTREFTLAPLFPITNYGYGYGYRRNDAENRQRSYSEAQARTIYPYDGRNPYYMWPGSYAVLSAQSRKLMSTADVPDADADVLSIKLKEESHALSADGDTRRLRYRFPAADYNDLRGKGAQQVSFAYDVPFADTSNPNGRGTLYASSLWDGDVLMLAPRTATKVTICWPGAGLLRDVPLPAGDGAAQVLLPPWQDGAVLTGTTTRNFAYEQTVGQGVEQRVIRSEDGTFSLKGLLPGPFILQDWNNGMTGTLLDLPPAGLHDVQLPGAGEPVIALLRDNSGAGQQVWWLPDGGAPTALPHVRSWVRVRDLPDHGAGWLWYADGRTGAAVLQRRLPEEGMTLPATASLGLTVPFDAARVPGAVHLVGTGALAGLTADFTEPAWCFSPFVGVTAATISAVPPGTYTVRVDTPAGPLEAPVTVTLAGGSVAFPAK